MSTGTYVALAVAVNLGVLGFLAYSPTPDPTRYSSDLQKLDEHFSTTQLSENEKKSDRRPPSAVVLDHYEPQKIHAPIMTGLSMKLFVQLLRLPVIGDALAKKLKFDNGYWKLRAFSAALEDQTPLFFPHKITEDALTSAPSDDTESFVDQIYVKSNGNIRKLHEAFVKKEQTPTEHIKECLQKIEESDNGKLAMRAVIMTNEKDSLRLAEEATKRFARGEKPKSLLDGVAVLVKTEFSVKGQVYSLGMKIIENRLGVEDALPVAKLREMGAIIVGVTTMHEIGLGTTGFNAFTGSARNPHNPQHHTGGSSSGSGAAVAAGLTPIALGGDGGGSVRIPSALCGVVGLKPTFGRVPASSEIAYTVGHVGPMARTVDDTAVTLELMVATEDERRQQWPQPKFYPSFRAKGTSLLSPTESQPLNGLRVGVFRKFTQDSTKEVLDATNSIEQKLQTLGATIVAVEIPFADVMFAAHTVSILSEMSASMDRHRKRFGDLSLPVQATLSIAQQLSSEDYVSAQMARRWFFDYTRNVLFNNTAGGCDVLLTPATGRTAPAIPEDPNGEINLMDTAAIMRFSTFGNLVGVPGIVVPVRKEDGALLRGEHNLPLSIQLQASHWQEPLLIEVAKHLE